jgi:hypothetical protein
MAPTRTNDIPPPPQTTGYKYGRLADTFIPATERTHKAKATKYVNRCIREHLEALSPGYNPKRVDPSLPNVQFSLGGTNYKDAGRYYQRVHSLKSRLVLYSLTFTTFRIRGARSTSYGSQDPYPKISLWTTKSLGVCSL